MIINEKYFKQFSPIPLNYDLSEIKNYIGVAEKIWVIPVIGIKLYDEIQKQVDENKLSDENSTLLTEGGLWQYLAFATCLESLAFIWANFSEVGITLGKSDNSESVTFKFEEAWMIAWSCSKLLKLKAGTAQPPLIADRKSVV